MAAEDRSRQERWRLEKLGHGRLTAVYGGQSSTTTRWNADDVEPRCLLAGRVRLSRPTHTHKLTPNVSLGAMFNVPLLCLRP